jgi:hypothetical protein
MFRGKNVKQTTSGPDHWDVMTGKRISKQCIAGAIFSRVLNRTIHRKKGGNR